MNKHPFLGTLLLVSVLITGIAARENNPDEWYVYQLNFLFIPAVHITMEIDSDTDTGLHEISFTTDTYGLISRLLEVHNFYVTEYNPETFTATGYEKSVQQSNMTQYVKADYTSGSVLYRNGATVQLTTENIHNIFTTLVHLRYLDPDLINTTRWVMELEGKQFRTSFHLAGYEQIEIGGTRIPCRKIQIIWEPVFPDQKSVIGPTDVFSYEVVNPGSERYIWIEDTEPHRIIRASFSLSPFWLTATLKEK